jgi:hypothetical protein
MVNISLQAKHCHAETSAGHPALFKAVKIQTLLSYLLSDLVEFLNHTHVSCVKRWALF